jgi:hypothetical protein
VNFDVESGPIKIEVVAALSQVVTAFATPPNSKKITGSTPSMPTLLAFTVEQCI